mgnify:FL=1
MTKWMIIASTAFIWSAGFAATGALAYAVRSPDPLVKSETAVVAKMPSPVAVVKTMPVQERVVVLPTVEIVGAPPPRVAKAKAQPPPEAKPAELHCTPFRPLEQGSSSVQICD